MTFLMPKLTHLIDISNKLITVINDHQAQVSEIEKQRFFSSWRASELNPSLIRSAEFIHSITQYIFTNKFEYVSIDPSLCQKKYEDVLIFLKKVTVGSMLFELSKITIDHPQKANAGSTTILRKHLLEGLSIDKISDVDNTTIIDCLQSLTQFIHCVDHAATKLQTPITPWYSTMKNDQLIESILSQMKHFQDWDIVLDGHELNTAVASALAS